MQLKKETFGAAFLFVPAGMLEFQQKEGKRRRKGESKYTKLIIIHDKALTL